MNANEVVDRGSMLAETPKPRVFPRKELHDNIQTNRSTTVDLLAETPKPRVVPRKELHDNIQTNRSTTVDLLAETPKPRVVPRKELHDNIQTNRSTIVDGDLLASSSQGNLRNFGDSSEELAFKLYCSLRDDSFEYGTASRTELIYSEMLSENNRMAKEALQKVLLKHYSDTNILCGLLRVISHFAYSELEPQGMVSVMACMSHALDEVTECAIRCCENWEDKDTLPVLKNIRCSSDWLNEYLKDVIKNIEQGD